MVEEMKMAMNVASIGEVVGLGIRINGGTYLITNLQIVSDGVIISAKTVKEETKI